MPYQKLKHDCGLLRTDGSTKVGFILGKRKGVPIWVTYDDEYILNQQTSEAGYDALPPEKEFTLILDDFRSGFGQQTYESSDPKRYHLAHNFDLRYKGMGILGKKATAATIPTLFAFTDGGMELWTGAVLTNWTNSGLTHSQEAAIVHGGTYSVNLDASGAGQYLYQTATNWSNNFRNTTVTITAWLYTATATAGKIAIWDGVGETSSSWVAGDSAWHQVQVTRKLDAAATELTCRIYNNDAAATVYADDVVVPTLGAHGKTWAEFDDDLFFSSNTCLMRVANGTGTITYQGGFPAAITALEPFQVSGTDYLFIAIGTSNAYWYMTAAEVFAESNAAVNKFQFFQRVYTTADTMYGNDGANTIRSTINPLNGGTAWSAVTYVSEAAYSITDLLSYDNALYMFKEDRPFYLDSSGNVQILTNITRAITNANGGKNSIEWQGKIYMPWGKTLLEDDSATYTWRNPASFGTNIGDFDGDIQALAADEEYLFLAIDNATKIEIMAGRLETIDGTTKWVYHPIAEITLTGAETMFVSSIYQKRLWIASTDSSNSLTYIPLEQAYGDPTTDANRDFQTGGDFTTPRLHANFKGDDKAFIKVIVEQGHSYDVDIYFEAHYKKQGDSSWTDIGDFKGSATSYETTKYIPLDASSNNPISKWMEFKIVGVTDDVTKTPQLKRFEVRGIVYPSKREIIYCEIRGASVTTKDGTEERDNSPDNIKTVLEEAKDATWPVTFYEYGTGDTITVKFLPTKPFSEMVKDEESGELERRYFLLLQKVSLS